jgi:DNA helicase HerA-like ATPase
MYDTLLLLLPIFPGGIMMSFLFLRNLSGHGRAAKRLDDSRNNNKPLWFLQLFEPVCIIEIISSGLMDRILALEGVKGFSIIYEKVPLSYALKVIESKMMSYRVELEYNPSNSKAKSMLEILSNIRDEISKYKDPIKPKLIIFINDINIAKEILAMLASINCKAELKKLQLSRNKSLFNKSFINRLKFWSIPISLKFIYMRISHYLLQLAMLLYPLNYESIPIGYTLAGPQTLLYLPLREAKGNIHTVVVGPTGKGKTYLLSLIVLLSKVIYNYKIYVLDPKGDLLNYLERLGFRDNIILLEDHSNICSLKNSRSMIIVDEAWRFSSSECINKMFRFGRSLGISVVVASQQPEDIPLAWWNNAGNVVVFGSKDSRYAVMVSRFAGINIDSLSLLSRLETGEILVRYDVTSYAIPAKVLPPLTIRLRAGGRAKPRAGGSLWVNG